MKAGRISNGFFATLAFFLIFDGLRAQEAADAPPLPDPGAAAQAEVAITARDGYARFAAKASGGRAHVAFLGGSITENQKGHSGMIPAWLEKRFPDCDFTFTRAGLSSTCSQSGAFRLQREVLAKGPVDLLVVEFAVNDDQDAGHAEREALRGMEGVLRQTLRHHPGADFLMVHFANPSLLELAQQGKDSVSIAAHEKVADYYGVTTVNVPQLLVASTAAGGMDWEAYGGVHPGREGYLLVSHHLAKALEDGFSRASGPEDRAERVILDPGSLDQVREVDTQEAAWLGGWAYGDVSKELLPVGSIRGRYLERKVLRGDEPGTMLYLGFSGTRIGAFVLAGPDAGQVEIKIDRGEWQTVELFHPYSKGLNYPRSVAFARDLEPGRHQLALRIADTRHPDSQGHAVTILEFHEGP